MSKTVIKIGCNDWTDLKGERIRFEFTVPWGNVEDKELEFSHTQAYYEDPRYPRYHVVGVDGEGYSFWEDDEVEVEILD